ncbi:MAG: hypothetical protein ACYTF1_14080 [Planctomycetota bacterium]
MIIATGVDGSGTSAIVKTLNELGVPFPGPYSFSENHEHMAARLINEKCLLDLTGQAWGLFPDYDDLCEYSPKIADKLGEDINWKDPRACITLPIWRDRVTRVIWIKRNPVSIMGTLLSKEYPSLGLNSRAKILDYLTRMEGHLFLSLAMFDIPFQVTLYENWWKEKDIDEVDRILQFCDHSVGSNEIMAALEKMRAPKQG